jgi:hypothetical protein
MKVSECREPYTTDSDEEETERHYSTNDRQVHIPWQYTFWHASLVLKFCTWSVSVDTIPKRHSLTWMLLQSKFCYMFR